MDTQIKLVNIQVTDLFLNVKTFDKEITNELETNLKFETGFDEENLKSFAIIFDLSINDEKAEFNLNVKVTAHFETNTLIDESFKNSSFVKISAPAIAFPYVRAFISNLTLNGGYNPIMLPSFNFVTIAETES